MSYLKGHGTRETPQRESIPGRTDQVENSEGGFVFAVDKWSRLRRFLILGSEHGTYYIGERKLTKQNVENVMACVKEDGPRTVEMIVEISQAGLAPKNTPAIFALAACFNGDRETKESAKAAFPLVCRIGTHVFEFATFIEEQKGWGRSVRTAVGSWYEEKPPEKLAYQLVKYRQRGDWTHKDILRLAHPKGATPEHKALYDWVVRGVEEINPGSVPAVIEGFDAAQKATNKSELLKVLGQYELPREALPTQYLNDPGVWAALLENMPVTAMIRNLGNMTKVGLLTPTSEATALVLEQLADAERLQKARVHPLAVLLALSTYQAGQGYRGKGTWNPVTAIVDALDAAFYTTFQNVEATNMRTLIGLDVSSSMHGSRIAGSFLPASVGATAMSLVTVAAEPITEVMAFTGGDYGYGSRRQQEVEYMTPLTISPRQRLDDVVKMAYGMGFGGTDCALPMLYALHYEREIDTFVIYTDSETWAGKVHPTQALQSYRASSGIPARLVVVGMTSNGFTIADPQDEGMLDVVGFDASAPRIISEFSAGTL